MSKDGSGNMLSSNLTLQIDGLLRDFPENVRIIELKQVTFVILRNIVVLRKFFSFYSDVGHIKQRDIKDKPSTMTRFQFWRFLKDIKVHHHFNHSLASSDRAISRCYTTKDLHNPTEKLYIQDFLQYCVALSYNLYKSNPNLPKTESNLLSVCMQRFLDEHLFNHSYQVGGQFLHEPRKSMKALMYMENCWKVYQYCCKTYSENSQLPHMRQFLFMLRDFEVLGKNLSSSTVLKILSVDDPNVCSNQGCNMELEMTFLEFFEALIGCALSYGFDNLKLLRTNTKQIPDKIIDLSDDSKLNLSPEQVIYRENTNDDFPVWSKQIHHFFTKILFPSWQNQQKITRAAQMAKIRSTIEQKS